MSFFTFTKLGRALLLPTAAIAMVVGGVMVGCGDGGGSGSAGVGEGGGNLVCADGEVWVTSGGDGMVFLADGTCVELMHEGNVWRVVSFDAEYTWTTSGNTLTLYLNGGVDDVMTYSVSGNRLTLSQGGQSAILTKQSGINW